MAAIEITKDVEALLEAARKENPARSDAEILKRALSGFYHEQELERRRKWAEGLPTLELSDEEKRSVARARKGEFVEMTIAELEQGSRTILGLH
jgi:hypothetical protein